MKYIKEIVLSLCTLALFFCVYLMLSNIRLLGDDLWYYTFLRHGANNFFEQLSSHYIYGNGRLFVHTVLAFLLAFDNLFIIKIVNFLMLLISGMFIIKLTMPNKANFYSMFLIVVSSFLMLGNYIVSDAYLWLSGSFNYVFPAMLLLIYTYLLKSSTVNTRYVLIIVMCGFSAITTEVNSILTLVISIVYCFTCIKTKKHCKLSIATVAIAFLGTISVLSSPGIVSRFVASGNGVGIIRRLLISFTTFSQMSWEANGMSYMIMISAVVCCICSWIALKNKILACLNGIVAIIAMTTVLGVTFSAYFCMLISALYIVVLICYSIAICNKKEDNVLIVCVLSLVASTGIIFVSAEATYRMLFVPAFCLMIIAVRSLALLDLSKLTLTGIAMLLCIGACHNSLNVYFANERNSNIWDENQKNIQSYSGSGILYLKNVYDERFFQSDFQDYFLGWYLNEYEIGKDVIVERTENKKYNLINENGDIISENIIKREKDYYIYCRELADYIDAKVAWEYGTANITYNGSVYRLKSGLNSIITQYIGGNSIRLSAPIRAINDKIYISLEDACSIFCLDLRIE